MTVLAAYMAGLALGAEAAGRLAYRVRRPVWAYAWLELGIGLAALAVPMAIAGAGRLHAALLGGRDLLPTAESVGSALFYLASSFAILMVPTALLGATLPLVARRVVTRDSQIGPRVALLYTVNTAGAAAGALAAAFFLLPTLGLGRTVLAAAAVNLLVFVLAAMLARWPGVASPVERASRPASGAAPQGGWVLPVMLISGAVSFVWEVLWTRLLVHLLGGSTYAFATMLAIFLAGIALGSAAASRFATTGRRAGVALAVAQLAVAALFLAAFASADRLTGFALLANEDGFLRRGVVLAVVLLLPGAVAMGATFPLAVRILARDAADATSASARVFAWNTVGGILGALAAGYLLLPAFGFAGTAAAVTAASIALALATSLAIRPRRRLLAAVAIAALLLLAWVRPTQPWRVLRHSPMAGQKLDNPVTYLGVGRSATVLLTDERIHWRLTTNGLPESSIPAPWARPGRYFPARWLSLLPLAARPAADSLLVIGLGAGITVTDLPETVREIHVVELEPEVVRANRQVASQRASDPLADPRLRLQVNDARGALRLTRRSFDVVVSQPSHPWTSGASNLFTREFFELVRDHLTPDGVFVQWMGLPFVDELLLRSLLATAVDVFPHVELYRPAPGLVMVLASPAPLDLAANSARGLEAARRQWRELGVLDPDDLLVARVLDGAGALAFAADAPATTDRHNLFRNRSALILEEPLRAAGANRLLAEYEPLSPPSSSDDALYLVRRLIRQNAAARARRFASTLGSSAARHTGAALADIATGRRREAVTGLTRALRLEPDLADARAALLGLHRSRVDRGEPLPGPLRAPLGPEAAVTDGWRLDAAGDWRGVRRLEERLAEIGPRHPLFAAAVRLRTNWRAASGEPRLAADALDLLEPILSPTARPEDLLLRARTASAARQPRIALEALEESLARRGRPEAVRAAAAEAGRILRSVQIDPNGETWRRALEERIAELSSLSAPSQPR